jgi:hypothetical protein
MNSSMLKRLAITALFLACGAAAQAAQDGGTMEPGYALFAAPSRVRVPAWALPGRMRFARCDGGPVEVCKAFMSGWEAIRHPDAILPCATFYDDATVAMLRRARVNWIWVTWSVGYSHESEAVQRRLLTPFIAKCHAAGIRVTAYVSLTNLFIDDMLTHEPRAKNWMQLEADGTPRPYSAAKYEGRPTRIIACVNNPEWFEYSKQRISSAVAAGVDAIQYDNSIQGCKCPLCREKFAEYTRLLYGQPFAVPGTRTHDASGFAQGREAVPSVETSGLAAKAWTAFCVKSGGDALAQRRAYADSLKPGILVNANAHQQSRMDDGLNSIFSEDGTEPGLRAGELASNIGLYKFFYAEADGAKPIHVECGRRIHGDRMDNPMPPRNQQLVVFESAACQASQGSFFEMGWTTKLARGDRDARDSLAALTTANQWLADHESLFMEAEPIAKTAVVLPAWQSLTPLVGAGKNFVVLHPKHMTPRQLAQFALVILLDVRCMTDEQAAAVRGYVGQGGRLIATGETSSCDSLWRPRAKPALASLQGAERCVWLPGKTATGELLDAWRRFDDQPLVELVSAPENLCFNFARSWDGKRTFLYLLNYGPQPVAGCEVKLRLPKKLRSLRLYKPGAAAAVLTATTQAGGALVKVPAFAVFAVLEAR